MRALEMLVIEVCGKSSISMTFVVMMMFLMIMFETTNGSLYMLVDKGRQLSV